MTSDCLLLPLAQGLDRVRVDGWVGQFFDLGEGEEQGYHRLRKPGGDWEQPGALTRRGGPSRSSYWYRVGFTHPGWAERTVLRFDGACVAANVWLNGRLLGSHYGYPGPFGFDISSYVGVENVLSVCVQATAEGGFLPPALDNLVDDEGPWWPVGLVGRVWLERMGAVAVEGLEVGWRLNPGLAQARIRTVLRNLDAREMEVVVGWNLAPADGSDGPPVARWRRTATVPGRGRQELETTVSIDRPRLWWPWTLGEQNLYSLGVAIDSGEKRSTAAARLVGAREVRLEPVAGGLAWVVNGQRHYPRGAVLPPLPPGEDADPIGAYRLAGLDLALCRQQLPSERTAAEADSAGVMLVIDPPAAEPRGGDDDVAAEHQHEAIALVASNASAAVLLQRGTGLAMELPATSSPEEPYTLVASDREQIEAARKGKFSATTALVLDHLPELADAAGVLAPTVALLDWAPAPDQSGLVMRFHVVNDLAAAPGRARLEWSVRAAEPGGWRLRRDSRGSLDISIPAPQAAPVIHEVQARAPQGALLVEVRLVAAAGDLSTLQYEVHL
ncbi:MAG: sugar-binding domain-containing protein [Candidatus Dormibacteria bacterium]